MTRVLALLAAITLCTFAFLPRPVPAQGRSQESKGKLRAGFHGGQTRHVYQHALKGFSVRVSEAAALCLPQGIKLTPPSGGAGR